MKQETELGNGTTYMSLISLKHMFYPLQLWRTKQGMMSLILALAWGHR
jgi:hypothetical protein